MKIGDIVCVRHFTHQDRAVKPGIRMQIKAAPGVLLNLLYLGGTKDDAAFSPERQLESLGWSQGTWTAVSDALPGEGVECALLTKKGERHIGWRVYWRPKMEIWEWTLTSGEIGKGDAVEFWHALPIHPKRKS